MRSLFSELILLIVLWLSKYIEAVSSVVSFFSARSNHGEELFIGWLKTCNMQFRLQKGEITIMQSQKRIVFLALHLNNHVLFT